MSLKGRPPMVLEERAVLYRIFREITIEKSIADYHKRSSSEQEAPEEEEEEDF